MNPYPDAVTRQPPAVPAAPVRRPGTLVAAVAVAVVSAVASVVDGVLYFAGGRDLARDLAVKALASVFGDSPSDGDAVFNAAVDEVQRTLQVRAGVALAFGALLLVFGLVMLGGATWARVVGTITGLLNAGIALRIASDAEGATGAIAGVAWLAAATALAVLVLVWLPANNRYAKARRTP